MLPAGVSGVLGAEVMHRLSGCGQLLSQAAHSGDRNLHGESIHSIVQAWLNGRLDASRP